jgi:hypothetical protein
VLIETPPRITRQKRILLLVASVAFLLTVLVPPWQITVPVQGASNYVTPLGYSLLVLPPTHPDLLTGSPVPTRSGVEVAFSRLSLEWAVILSVLAVSWLLSPFRVGRPSSEA